MTLELEDVKLGLFFEWSLKTPQATLGLPRFTPATLGKGLIPAHVHTIAERCRWQETISLLNLHIDKWLPNRHDRQERIDPFTAICGLTLMPTTSLILYTECHLSRSNLTLGHMF